MASLLTGQVARGSEGSYGNKCNLKNLSSSKNAEVAGGSTARGAPVIQWTPHGGDNQVFVFVPFGPRGVVIQNARSGQVLDVAGGSTAAGAPVIQWPWNGGANQVWFPTGAANLAVFVNGLSGQVLDVAGASLADGAPLIQWPYHAAFNQFFIVNCLPRPVTTTTTTAPTTTTTRPTTTTTRPTTTTTRPTTTTTTAAGNTAGDALNVLNRDRTSRGLPALRVRSDLQVKAQAWAEKMARENAEYHSTLSEGLEGCWTALGENIAPGSSVTQAEQLLMDDPPHRANILDSRWNWVGVGVASTGSGVIVVQVFMAGCL